jgi:tRNA A-37 threonylcarbamoyl transferase component Bud32
VRDGATLDPAVLTGSTGGGVTAARVRWGTVDGRSVVIKRARGEERPVLRREAAVLRALAGPDVVRVVDLREHDDATELVMGAVSGRTLGALVNDPAVTPGEIVATLVATCDTVSRLHARGWCHGALGMDHVLVTMRGRVRLCSLSAGIPGDHDDATAVDRASLLRMVDRWTADGGTGLSPWRRARHHAMARRVRRRTARLVDDPDPAVLARILRRAAAPQRLRTAAVVAAVAAVALLGFSCTARLRDDSGPPVAAAVSPTTATTRVTPTTARTEARSPGPTAPSDRCPTIDATAPDTDGDRCGDIVDVAGNDVSVNGTRYRIGEVGDSVVVADTDCDGRATAVDLRVRTGELFEFTTWARPGAPAIARTVGAYPGARRIEPSGGACGPVRVVLADGSRHDTGGTP